MKSKRAIEDDFVVTGYRIGDDRIDAVSLASHNGTELVDRGIVELGIWRIRDVLEQLPIASRHPRSRWCRVLGVTVVNVTYASKTNDGRLRLGVIRGVRAE
jgi:ATP-dependent DNA ligase